MNHNHRKSFPSEQPKKIQAYTRKHHLKKTASKFGFNLNDVVALLKNQDNRCAVCLNLFDLNPESKRSYHFDHDHITGQFRGLLCVTCNIALGGFKDDPKILRNAIKYLARSLDKHGE